MQTATLIQTVMEIMATVTGTMATATEIMVMVITKME
jgi:hypothetical protein